MYHEVPVVLDATAELMLVERYAGSAFDMSRFRTARDFAAKYGEVAQIIPYTGLPADRTVEMVFDLHRRHAAGVDRAIRTAVESRSRTVTPLPYPPGSLLGAVAGRNGTVRSTSPVPSPAQTGPVEFIVDHSRFEVRCGNAVCFLGNTRVSST